MLTRRIVALVIAGASMLGVVSATSLGSFDPMTLSAVDEQREPCRVGTVEFYSGGSLLTGLLSLLSSTVDQVGLRDLAGVCNGLRPVVVVYGDPDTLDGTTETVVLSRTELSTLAGTSDVLEAIDVTDELNALLDLTDDPTEARVALCPAAATDCGP